MPLTQSSSSSRPILRTQIECHPFFAQTSLRRTCESQNIIVQAYCPLARGHYYGDSTLKGVASETGKSEAQVMLRWLVQHGIVPLPKSSNEKRQVENAQTLEFELSSEQMKSECAASRARSRSLRLCGRLANHRNHRRLDVHAPRLKLRTGRPGQRRQRTHRKSSPEPKCSIR